MNAVGADLYNYDNLITGFSWLKDYTFLTGEVLTLNFDVLGTIFPKAFYGRKTTQVLRFSHIEYCEGLPGTYAINDWCNWSYSDTYNGSRTTATVLTMF